MTDSIEKVICCEKGNDNPMAMAAMMNGGMNGQWNNPFIYLVWMMFAQRMWGNGYGTDGNGANNPQIAALQSQMQDNHNSDLIMQGIAGNTGAIKDLSTNLNCDFNTLNSCCCDIRNGISKLSGEIGYSAERIINAVNMGDCNVIEAVKNCCCETQKEFIRQSGENRLAMCEQTNTLQRGQFENRVALDKAVATLGFETQKQTCELKNAISDSTSTIVRHLDQHWSNEDQRKIQDLKAEISQLKQTQEILAALGAPAYLAAKHK